LKDEPGVVVAVGGGGYAPERACTRGKTTDIDYLVTDHDGGLGGGEAFLSVVRYVQAGIR